MNRNYIQVIYVNMLIFTQMKSKNKFLSNEMIWKYYKKWNNNNNKTEIINLS